MRVLSGLVATATALTCFVLPAQAAGDIDLCVSNGRAAGFTGEKLVVAVAVGMAESRCDPSARYVNSDSHQRLLALRGQRLLRLQRGVQRP
jgi:hypothetical protein